MSSPLLPDATIDLEASLTHPIPADLGCCNAMISADDDRRDESEEYAGIEHLRKACSPPVVPMDLKAPYRLLDLCSEPKNTDFDTSRIIGTANDTHVSMVRAVGDLSPGYMPHKQLMPIVYIFYVMLLGIIARLQLLKDLFYGNTSVQDPLIEMVLSAHKRFEDTFACVKSMAPKDIFDMAKRLCSFASPNMCEAVWISGKPKSVSPKAGTVSEFHPRESIGRRNELTENESQQHSDPYSCGAERGIKAVKEKTSVTWVVATAAPHHATGNSSLLSGFVTEHDDLFVHAVDRAPMKVRARGAVFTDAVVLPNVWFVPGLAANLVSVSQLAELDYSVGFGCGVCYIRSAADGTIVGKAHLREGGLYVLDYLKVPLAL